MSQLLARRLQRAAKLSLKPDEKTGRASTVGSAEFDHSCPDSPTRTTEPPGLAGNRVRDISRKTAALPKARTQKPKQSTKLTCFILASEKCPRPALGDREDHGEPSEKCNKSKRVQGKWLRRYPGF
jgi:hypothetical protein